jgi:hypothetical protein
VFLHSDGVLGKGLLFAKCTAADGSLECIAVCMRIERLYHYVIPRAIAMVLLS